jgi:hypothetical protein
MAAGDDRCGCRSVAVVMLSVIVLSPEWPGDVVANGDTDRIPMTSGAQGRTW